MKVLVVHDFAARYGGGENMALGIRDSLRDRGHQARMFSSRAEAVPGVVREADVVTFGTISPVARLSRVANPVAAWDLRCELRDFQPDIVHVRMFLSQLSPLILPVLRAARRKSGTRSILHVVTPDPICPLGTKTLPDGSECHSRPGVNCRSNGCLSWPAVARTLIQLGSMRRWFDVFDVVYANSQSMAEQLREDGLRCDGYIWNGVPDVARQGMRGERPTAFFAGRLVPIKGVDVLIRCWKTVVARHPNAVLKIAGDGPQRDSLQQLAKDHGVSDSVEFLGHRTRQQLAPIADAAWVQAVPSLWREPFGISCAEAMMRGLPVIATASGGLAEQVIDGETGRLCPPGDDAAWAAAINDLFDDPKLCDQMGRAGRDRALREFSEDQFIERWLTLYESILRDTASENKSVSANKKIAGTNPPPTVCAGAMNDV